MEEIVARREVPAMPEGVKVRYLREGELERQKGEGLSEELIRGVVERVRTGECLSLELSLDEYNEEGYLLLESSPDLIFLQIWYGETGTAWACFNPEYLNSDEISPIECSDGQSEIGMKITMRNRELAAKCVEWYAHTLEPYPGMDWLKMIW